MKTNWFQRIKRWVRLSPRPIKKSNLVKVGYAILSRDEKTKGRYWLTYNKKGKDKLSLGIGQPIRIPVTVFKIGAVIEIYEEKGKS